MAVQTQASQVGVAEKQDSIVRVLFGSATGTMIEWYDFYIFGSLTAVLALKFYPPGNDTFALIERNMKRIATGVAGGFGATAEVDFRSLFPPLINDAQEAAFIAETAAEVVGADNMERNGNLVMASEDFSYMLNRRPGAYIRIGNGDGPGTCQVHNPGYDFNDAALPIGASLFARVVERKLARS